MAIKEETVEHHFAQKGKGNCFFCGEVRERIGVSWVSARNRSKATRVAEIKASWKRQGDSFGGGGCKGASNKRQARGQKYTAIV